MVAAAHVRIDDCGEKITERAERGAVAHEPAPEARMGIAHLPGHDLLAEILIGALGALRRARERRVKLRGHIRWRRLPHRAAPGLLQVVERIIDRAVRKCAQLRPVFRIECFLR